MRTFVLPLRVYRREARYRGALIQDTNAKLVADMFGEDANENATFIVLAVNNHDSLLAALRAAHTRFGQMWPGRSPYDDEAWALVDAAIKRVEGV